MVRTKKIKMIKSFLNKIKLRLAWLLIGDKLLFRLKNLEHMMDLATQKMEDIDGLESQVDKAKMSEEQETWSRLYFRYYDLHAEVGGLIDYMRGK